MSSCVAPALDLSRDDEQFLSASDLRKRFSGASSMWLERLIENDPTFPAAWYVRGRRFWRAVEIQQWMQTLSRTKSETRSRVESQGPRRAAPQGRNRCILTSEGEGERRGVVRRRGDELPARR